MKTFAAVSIIVLATLLHGCILAAIIWLCVDYYHHPVVADSIVWIVLCMVLLAGGIFGGFVAFQWARISADRLIALAWGALSAVIGPVLLAAILIVSMEPVLSFLFGHLFGLLALPAMMAVEVVLAPMIVLRLRRFRPTKVRVRV